jgi:multidrug efflux pump subunit AcrB
MVGILFVGIVAYPKLPVAPLPQVDFPTIQVSAQLPGASPETMASAVAQPLETQFAQIPGVSQMTSSARSGSTAITIQFDLDRNIDGAASDVQARDQRRRRTIAEGPAEPADLSEGQPGGFAPFCCSPRPPRRCR